MAVLNSTDENFEQLLKQHEKVIVKYYADWCGSCKLFAPKFKRLSEDERFKEVTFLEVNAEENENARRRSGVNNLPYFSIFLKGELLTGDATSKEEAVLEMIRKLN